MWNDEEGHKKIHLANWPSICMKKEYGGLGIPNLQDLNVCLIGSWIRRYINGEGSLWKGVMWAARAVKFGYKWLVGNGRSIKFWEDSWYGNAPLAVIYWDVYMLVNQQTQTISELWDGQQLKCTFRRIFYDDLMAQWLEIIEIAKEINFNDSPDQLI
jgi:hypothetical protein